MFYPGDTILKCCTYKLSNIWLMVCATGWRSEGMIMGVYWKYIYMVLQSWSHLTAVYHVGYLVGMHSFTFIQCSEYINADTWSYFLRYTPPCRPYSEHIDARIGGTPVFLLTKSCSNQAWIISEPGPLFWLYQKSSFPLIFWMFLSWWHSKEER